jgi:abhydrolase domain-containing protein 12
VLHPKYPAASTLTNWPGNQVTPFYIKTVDGETLYAWHILPLPLYAKHEDKIAASREPGFVQDVTATESFRLLKDEKDAKVILYCTANTRPETMADS